MSDAVRERNIGSYLETLSSSEPAPGGGSVCGLVAALAMGLGRMVISLSDPSPELQEAETTLKRALDASILGSDADEAAYGGYVQASRLPRSTPEEKASRKLAMQESLQSAALVPMELAELMHTIKPVLQNVSDRGSTHVTSDAQIALILADAVIESCFVNVNVNLPYLKDEDLIADLNARMLAITG